MEWPPENLLLDRVENIAPLAVGEHRQGRARHLENYVSFEESV
jgi:hypothetical protein